MSYPSQAFLDHAASGLTQLCRCWEVTRKDGVTFGFTDHDLPLSFEGVPFEAESGLSASAFSQSTGLSVDNSEAMGALSAESIREEDIEAGRFDDAAVRAWLVNWQDVSIRYLQFRGTIGEIRRVGGAFHAELRGLTEGLNRPLGRIYQKPCTAVLGDGDCCFNSKTVGFYVDLVLDRVQERRVLRWEGLGEFEAQWFQRGRLDVLSGAGAGLWGSIKDDRFDGADRVVELWEPLRGALGSDTVVRLSAGCDKRFETCVSKFDNILNFQGFPDIPGEDWIMRTPRAGETNGGGSLR